MPSGIGAECRARAPHDPFGGACRRRARYLGGSPARLLHFNLTLPVLEYRALHPMKIRHLSYMRTGGYGSTMKPMSVVVARNGARAVATDKRVQGWHWGLAKGSFHAFSKFIRRAYSSLVNIPQPKSAGQILLALTLCSSCAIDAYGWSSASLLHPSIRQEERT